MGCYVVFVDEEVFKDKTFLMTLERGCVSSCEMTDVTVFFEVLCLLAAGGET